MEGAYATCEVEKERRVMIDQPLPSYVVNTVADLQERIRVLEKSIDHAIAAMRITQRLFGLEEGHILMQTCHELERIHPL